MVIRNYYQFLELIAFISFICILISIPIASLSLELAILIMHLSNLLMLIIIILDASIKLGFKNFIKFFVSAFMIGSVMEIIGVLYGVPFGKYHYTEVFRLKILGLVPLAIPINWFLITYVAFSITNWITGSAEYKHDLGSIIKLSALDSLIATSWDIIVDPIMVHVIGAWIWETRGDFYGIPLSNFAGWLIVSFIITLTYRIILLRERRSIDLTHLPALIYFQLWLIMVAVALISNQLNFIIPGSIAMNTVLLCYFLKAIKKSSNANK